MKTPHKPATKPNLQSVMALLDRRRAWMRRAIRDRWIMMVLIAVFFGCASAARTVPFQNMTHRQLYSLGEDDLKKVQFYISTDVVAQHQDVQGTRAFLIAKMTPGIVTSAGPNWIKVSFREGGVDVPFITDLKQNDGRYWVASEVAGSKDFTRVSELPGNVFLYKGSPLSVVSGSDAYLLVDWESWRKVVETRKVTEGRRVGGQ
jgi:hypothetical protein